MLTSTKSLDKLIPQDPNITDDRPTLAKFRRLGLYVILNHNGHDVAEDMPYTEMLAFAKAHEPTLSLEGLIVTPGEYGGFKVAKPKKIIEEEKDKDKKIQEKRSAYDEAEWDDLKAEARELNLNIERMQKEEVVAAIVDAKKDTKTGYEDLSWPELKKVAKERGIEIFGKKKAELIAELKGE